MKRKTEKEIKTGIVIAIVTERGVAGQDREIEGEEGKSN